jgi:predicted  nucleic acid-binding Zn-ribbon protein
MKQKMSDLVCANCGSNRFMFPKSAEEQVKCDECDEPVATLHELQARIVRGPSREESREARAARHAAEVADSHDKLRASVAETDRLIVASNEMLQRHREESDDESE